MIIVYILLLVICVFSIMSFFSLRKLKKQQYSNTNFTDDRYYELKYKLQFISSVGIIIIGVCGFLGYDTFDRFVYKFEKQTDSLNLKIQEYDKKISAIDTVIKKYDGKIQAYNKVLKNLDASKNRLSGNMFSSNQQLASLVDTIDIIKKRNILDKSFYVIDNLIKKNDDKVERFYFKDMSTIIGDKLPNFNEKPVLFIIPQSGAQIMTKTITTEYIEVGFSGYGSFEESTPLSFAFGLLIAKRLK